MQVAVRTKPAIARPLKVLVPLIQDELTAGNDAGLEHYRRAGEMLMEAREQVAAFKWTAWLTKNFALSKTTASALSSVVPAPERLPRRSATSARRIYLGEEPRRERHAIWEPVREITARIDTDRLGQERQARDEEMRFVTMAVLTAAGWSLIHGAYRPAKVSRRWRKAQERQDWTNTVEYPRWRSPKEERKLTTIPKKETARRA